MLDLFRLLLPTLAALFHERHDLMLENLLVRHQLHVALRSRTRTNFKTTDRFFWLVVRRLYPAWRRHLVLVRPETVLRWHRRGWRLYWRWRSGRHLGRPRLSPEIRELIATMASQNPLCGTEPIRGELLKLGIVVSCHSIRRYRRRRHSHPPSQSWRTFLANHAHSIWVADLFVVQTLTFQTLFVLLFISHGRRQLVHFRVTGHPTAAWVWRQLIEATPWNIKPDYRIHDRDRVWGADLGARTSLLGIKSLRTPIRAPRANAIAERWVRTVRGDCLDHLIPLSERHLRAILTEFLHYYNHDRPQSQPRPAASGSEAAEPARRNHSSTCPRRTPPCLSASSLNRTDFCRPTGT
jgi:transposase InsO family protein